MKRNEKKCLGEANLFVELHMELHVCLPSGRSRAVSVVAGSRLEVVKDAAETSFQVGELEG